VLFCLLILLQVSSIAQEIQVSADNQPLSELLVQLRDHYAVAFSFNDTELRKYSISVDRQFQTVGQMLGYLLKDYPLAWDKTGDVYVIYPQKKKSSHKPVKHFLRGRIVERKTLESLPYSNIAINDAGTISDDNGYFSHRSTDSIFHLQISHLGYYRIDTILSPGKKHLITMTPSVEQIDEVVVTDRLAETFLYSEDHAGVLHMNHKITRFLPGSSNNSVFNLLRLQSGITATAEASESLIIWGSYEGHSRILFDDIVLFGLKNFNDNIGTVNPFVVKDIKLMKAAFGANYGDCVGGIADITGKDGNRKQFSMDFSVDNYTLNGMLETPVTENSSLILAFRHTYRSLYENMNWDLTPNRETKVNSDITIVPDYIFRDMNLKYTFRNEQGFHVRLNILAGQDNFSYNVDEKLTRWFRLERNTFETGLQKGASLVIGKNGENGLTTRLTMSYSGMEAKYDNEQKVVNDFNNNTRRSSCKQTINATTEARVKLESKWAVNNHHKLEGAFSWIGNRSSWSEDTAGLNFFDQQIRGAHITLMTRDRMNFGKFRLVPGIRITRLPYLEKSFLEPRISASYEISEALDFNLAAGLYRQYLTKNSVEDEYGNYRYMWTVANDSEYPVLRSKHLAASLTLEKKNTHASLSPFYKKTNGLTRYANFRARNIENLFKGQSRSYGVDFYIKRNFLGHSAWISYTLSETEESFEHFPNGIYLYAPHDQRHELKLATLLNFNPIYFSANYVYGSGFPIPNYSLRGVTYDRIPYHRADAALTYKFSLNRFYGEAGISILNVFDRKNLLYNNLERVPTSQTSNIKIYQQSVPFTPTLYLKVGF
jgi:hypothetical protein